MGLFKIVKPKSEYKNLSVNEKTLTKIILCEWCIVFSQEKFLHAQKNGSNFFKIIK